MKIKFTLFLILLFNCSISFSQNLEWVKSLNGPDAESSNKVITDSEGNVYSAGRFSNTIDFDPGEEVFNLTPNFEGSAYISKLDSNGNFVWAKCLTGQFSLIATNTFVTIRTMDLDSSGNILITGGFNNTVDFDPGQDVFNLTANSINNLYILKLDSNGNFLWVKNIGPTNNNGFGATVRSIATDNNDNIYTTGNFSGTVDFDPGIEIYSETSSFVVTFILKLDSQGNFVWLKRPVPTTNIYGEVIKIDTNDNIYLGGWFNSQTDFDPNEGQFNLIPVGLQDVYILKLNPEGNFIWAKSFGGNSSTYISSLDIDSLGNVLVVGSFSGISDFDPSDGVFNITAISNYDSYITKLDSIGNFIWAKSFPVIGESISIFDVKTDEIGNIYTAGNFNGLVDFDTSESVYNLSSGSNNVTNSFFCKLDISGNLVWGTKIGEPNPSNGISCVVRSFTLDPQDNLIVTGVFYENVDFNPSEEEIYNLIGDFTGDIFVLKLSQPNLSNISFEENTFEVKAYPNPFSDHFTISFELEDSKTNIEVYDITGKMIQKLSTQGNIEINPNWTSGVYLLQIEQDQKIQHIRLIKK